MDKFKEAQEHLEQSRELNATEKTLVTWLRKNADKLKTNEPNIQQPQPQPQPKPTNTPTNTNGLNTTAR